MEETTWRLLHRSENNVNDSLRNWVGGFGLDLCGSG